MLRLLVILTGWTLWSFASTPTGRLRAHQGHTGNWY